MPKKTVQPKPTPPHPRRIDPEGRPTLRWNQVRWRTKRKPLNDRELLHRYHSSKPFTGALHPSVFRSPRKFSAFSPDTSGLQHQPTPPCSRFPNHLSYRIFHNSLPPVASLPRL
jgi:hypothetical protein